MRVNPLIFRAYDIRGIYRKDLNEEIIKRIGNAFAKRKKEIIIGRDARTSSRALKKAFIKGAIDSGCRVIDVDMVPIGVCAFYGYMMKKDVAYITASHLPKEWNGVKFIHKNGIGYEEKENYQIRDCVLKGHYVVRKTGSIKKMKRRNVIDKYVEFFKKKIGKPREKLRILIDSGNGVAPLVTDKLFKEFGLHYINKKIDGTFPSRPSEPKKENIKEAIKLSKKFDIAIAFDGDADRMVMIHNSYVISPEEIAYIALKKGLKGKIIVANVECSMLIDDIARLFNKKVKRIRVGHTYLMRNVRKYRACIGIESSGHYTIPSINAFDDALVVSYFISCIISEHKDVLDELNSLPKYYQEKFEVPCKDEVKFKVMEKLKQVLKRKYKLSCIDGIKIVLKNAWVLIRPSNTSPIIRVTIEAEEKEKVDELKHEFLTLVKNFSIS